MTLICGELGQWSHVIRKTNREKQRILHKCYAQNKHQAFPSTKILNDSGLLSSGQWLVWKTPIFQLNCDPRQGSCRFLGYYHIVPQTLLFYASGTNDTNGLAIIQYMYCIVIFGRPSLWGCQHQFNSFQCCRHARRYLLTPDIPCKRLVEVELDSGMLKLHSHWFMAFFLFLFF